MHSRSRRDRHLALGRFDQDGLVISQSVCATVLELFSEKCRERRAGSEQVSAGSRLADYIDLETSHDPSLRSGPTSSVDLRNFDPAMTQLTPDVWTRTRVPPVGDTTVYFHRTDLGTIYAQLRRRRPSTLS